MTPLLFVLYFAIGAFTLLMSRRAVENCRGFSAVGESLILFLLWPFVWFVRLIIFAIEGNLWENLN